MFVRTSNKSEEHLGDSLYVVWTWVSLSALGFQHQDVKHWVTVLCGTYCIIHTPWTLVTSCRYQTEEEDFFSRQRVRAAQWLAERWLSSFSRMGEKEQSSRGSRNLEGPSGSPPSSHGPAHTCRTSDQGPPPPEYLLYIVHNHWCASPKETIADSASEALSKSMSCPKADFTHLLNSYLCLQSLFHFFFLAL